MSKNEDGCTALLLPKCEYSLKDLVYFPNDRCKEILRKLTYQKKVQILVEIAEGIKYLHSNNRIHRDIKVSIELLDYFQSANIMMLDGHPLIADFGLSREWNSNKAMSMTAVGTPML